MDDELTLSGTNFTSEAARRSQLADRRREAYLKLVREFEPDPECPLVTPYTRFMGIDDATMRHLYAIRLLGSRSVNTSSPATSLQAGGRM